MAYGITNQSQIINLDEIKTGCNMLASAAEALKEYGNSVVNISDICDTKALSANGKSMVPVIQEKGATIVKIGEELSEYASNLLEAASEVYRIQNNEYAAYVEEQKKNDN